MTATPIGIAFAALFAVSLIGGRSTFVWAIAISLFFQDSAMVVVAGSVGIAPYTVALVIALVLQVVFVVRTRRADRPQKVPLGLLAAGSWEGVWLRRALLVLVVYGTVVSIVGPAVFRGFQVMPSQGSSDYLVDRLPALDYSLSNAAQIAYLLLNVVLVWYLATLPRLPRGAFFVGILVVAAVVVVALVLRVGDLPWPSALFDNSPRNYYSDPANDPRLRAHFSEPSHLAWFLALALAYGARLLSVPPLWRRIVCGALVLVCALGVLADPSTTIILALAVLVPAAVVVVAIRFRARLRSRRGLLTLGGVAVAAVALVAALWQPISGFLGPALLGKIGSSSQYSRGKQDLHALDLFLQSFGIGVGLGSNRSSSLATMLLSDIGLVGTVAYYVVVVLSIVILFRHRASAEGWALTALTVACGISVADFVSPPTWFLIGMAAYLSRPAVRFGGAHRLPVVPRRLPALTGVGR